MGKLATATYDFGCHAVSGLCNLLPELCEQCHHLALDSVTIDLLSDKPLPPPFCSSGKLANIVIDLREKFFSILEKHSLHLRDHVARVTISLEFQNLAEKGRADYYYYSPDYVCKVISVDTSGRSYQSQFGDSDA
jgi:hypothetical protein